MELYKKTIENRQMSQDLMKKFIEMYKAHPNLWKTNSENYRNKTMKAKSYNTLIKLISCEIPNADRKFIAKKINTIRVCFRKEYRKWLENKNYKPMLWYYNSLLFIVNENVRKKSNKVYHEDNTTFETNVEIEKLCSDSLECSSNIDQLVDETDYEKFEEKTCFESVNIQNNSDMSNDFSIEETIEEQSFKRNREENDNVSDSQYKISPVNFQKISQLHLDEFEAFGHFISKKLKQIALTNCDQYIFCENIISQAIMKAQLGKLNENSSVTC